METNTLVERLFLTNDRSDGVDNQPRRRECRNAIDIRGWVQFDKIEADEFDRGERLVMNYGHSFGHALESVTGYRVPHGIAVTIGMDLANFISCEFGFMPTSAYDELHGLLSVNYEGWEYVDFDVAQFLNALSRDKKNRDGLASLILAKGPGEMFIERRPLNDHFRSICVEYFRGLSDSRPSRIDSVSQP